MRHVKKALSLLASAFVVLIMSGFLSLKPVSQEPPRNLFVADGVISGQVALAHHTDVPIGCYDATMVPKAVRLLTDPSKSDSGQLDFNAYNHDYQACDESKQPSDNLLHGWVFNTNFGDVSFSCKNGDNYGINCGNKTDYGAVANPTDGKGPAGRIRGFAWGDNVGWISMGCDNDKFNMGVACGDIEYGVQIAASQGDGAGKTCNALPDPNQPPVLVEKDDLYGYAWADSVGWINFCGAHMSLFDPPPSIIAANLQYKIAANNKFPNGETYANGEDYYQIVVEILKDGKPIKPGPPQDVSVSAVDWYSTLQTDQINPCQNPPVCYDGALIPHENEFIWDSDLSAFVGKLYAMAPTNSNLVNPSNNYIQLKSISVTIEGVINLLQENNKFFDFKPAISVTRVKSDAANDVEGDSLLAFADTSTNHTVTVEHYLPSEQSPAKITEGRVYTQLHDCQTDPNINFKFQFDPAPENDREKSQSDGVKLGDVDPKGADAVCSPTKPNPPDGSLVDADRGSDFENDGIAHKHGTPLSDFVGNIDANSGEYVRAIKATSLPQNISKVSNSKTFGILTRVSYAIKKEQFSKNVQYVSRKVTDGSLLNQAADVRGNVRIDVQKVLVSDSISKSIGENSGSKREAFYRAIKALAVSEMLADSKTFGNTDLNKPPPANLNYYTFDSGQPNKPCQIILSDDSGKIEANQDSTIIAEGCDIYIDTNIIMPAKKQLGLISLEDVSLGSVRRGGNVYLCSDVTDVSGVNIVADGGILSYADCTHKNNAINQADGLPVFPDGARTTLKNQLAITGSIISNNTYGGSLQSPPILGDGTKIVVPAESYKARLYDINFLRYANTKVVDLAECWDGKLAQTLTDDPPTCDNNNPANKDTSIINIRYQAPSSNLPVFKDVNK